MAQKLEKKTARILALILAFIMLGSVFAYISPKGVQEKRDVKLKIEDFRNWIDILPENGLFYYFNLTELGLLSKKLGDKDPLVNFTEEGAINALHSAYLSGRIVQFSHPIEEFVYADYGYHLYLIDNNDSKVFFARDTNNTVGNFDVQFSKYGVAMISEVSPLVIGYSPLVIEVAEKLNSRKTEYSDYLLRLNDTFVFAFFTYGKKAGEVFRMNQTNDSIADFFFQGFRYNSTSQQYEKVWGVHFTQNYFFTGINESERGFEYYHFENFDDGFSIAVMGDKNFTKIADERTAPPVMGFIIKEVEEVPQKE
ncbi:MAG: hypothetical protein PWQ58_1413 [Archaeoglobaceae archaeon]|nr:hypothetical protein [Archaeoglobaceae archaeon]